MEQVEQGLIRGKEALIALANGEEVEVSQDGCWLSCDHVKALQVELIIEDYYKFRLKPRTITINDIEVPAPFEPKAGEQAFYITAFGNYDALVFDWQLNDFGYWRTEEEIRQVVAALRKVFGG